MSCIFGSEPCCSAKIIQVLFRLCTSATARSEVSERVLISIPAGRLLATWKEYLASTVAISGEL